jgi:hypothetical protein
MFSMLLPSAIHMIFAIGMGLAAVIPAFDMLRIQRAAAIQGYKSGDFGDFGNKRTLAFKMTLRQFALAGLLLGIIAAAVLIPTGLGFLIWQFIGQYFLFVCKAVAASLSAQFPEPVLAPNPADFGIRLIDV